MALGTKDLARVRAVLRQVDAKLKREGPSAALAQLVKEKITLGIPFALGAEHVRWFGDYQAMLLAMHAGYFAPMLATYQRFGPRRAANKVGKALYDENAGLAKAARQSQNAMMDMAERRKFEHEDIDTLELMEVKRA